MGKYTMSEEEPDNKPVWTNWDGSQKKFYNAGGCYEMLLCFLLARGCPGGMEHTAASQSLLSDFLWGYQL